MMSSNERMEIEFDVEKTDETWPEYGIAEKHLSYNNQPTRFKAIVKDNNFITLVSKRYTVIPNELLEEEIVPLIHRFGFESIDSPAKSIDNNRYFEYFVRPELKHVGNEQVKFGLLLKNSIDGSLSLGLEAFTYRMLCKNGMIAGKESTHTLSRKHMGDIKTILQQVEQGIAVINKASLQTVQRYEQMMREKFREERFDKLKRHLPKKDLIDVASSIGKSEWDAFNQVTQNIWHNGRANLLNQYSKMQTVNRVFEV